MAGLFAPVVADTTGSIIAAAFASGFLIPAVVAIIGGLIAHKVLEWLDPKDDIGIVDR